jgi:O-antigen/teichoic acid export membrane protein
VILLGSSFVSNLLLLVNVLIVARLLGGSLYGQYTLSISPATIFILFSGVGVNTAITRFAAYHVSRGEINEARRKTANGIIFLLLFGSALSLASYLFAPFIAGTILHRPFLEPDIRLASLAVIGQIAFQCGIASLVGWSSPKPAGAAYIIQAVIKVTLAPALILLGFAVFGTVLAQVSSLLVAAFVAIITLYIAKLRGADRLARAGNHFFSDVKEMIKYGIPSEFGQYFSNFASQNYVTIILGIITTDVVVGNFQVATGVTAIISVVSTSLTLSLFAGFSSLHGQNRNTGQAFVYAVKYVAYAITPFIFFLIAGAVPIIRVVFGIKYAGAAPLLALISFSNIPMIIGQSVFTPYFNGIGKTRLTMLALAADGLAALALAPILGKFFGAYGITIALLGSNLASGVTALYLAKSNFGIQIDYGSSLRALGVSAVCAAVTFAAGLVNSSTSLYATLAILVIEFVIFFGLYLLLAPLFSVVDKSDIARLTAATKGMRFFSGIALFLLRVEDKFARGSKQSSSELVSTSDE